MKRRIALFLQMRFINPRVRTTAGNVGNRYALLETTGRRSGRSRQTPVGNGLDGDVFWIVSEHGRQASYVQNLISNPRVRIKVGGTWRAGVARVADEEDSNERLKKLDQRTAAEIKRLGSSLLTIRVDLERQTAGDNVRPIASD
ncbi:MAG TPA: nitroreductase/quinone reductase family protein [Candidatus Dormibacteraeota bacterium]|nr:nitroreductase/quinone reductase family protein [Candidatus Dormibacteraeota bacterium]